MKIFNILILLALFCSTSFGQSPAPKIKILLLGTFHFNQSLDSDSRLHSHLFTDQRQKEVEDLVNKLVAFKPDKIFLEFTQKDQVFYDSIYTDYLHGKEPARRNTKANEYFQLGMKTAKKLRLKKVTGVNYQPEELSDSLYKPKNDVDRAVQNLYKVLGSNNDSSRTNDKFYDLPFPYKLPKLDSVLQNSTLSQFLLYLNSPLKLQRDDYTNWNYLYSMGSGNDMSFTDYVGTFWYGANVRNFNNILRQADYGKDRCYLLIYGSSHIPFLKFLFSMHPYFDVVNLTDVLK